MKSIKPTKRDYLKAMETVEKHGVNRYTLGTPDGPKCIMGHIINVRWPVEFNDRIKLPSWMAVGRAMGFSEPDDITRFNDYGMDGDPITKNEALIFLGFGAAGAFK